MKHQIYGKQLTNMPYEPRPNNYDGPIWRYSKNPIIKMNPFPNASRVFNSAVIAYQGAFIGVFRADTKSGIPYLFVGHSKNGIDLDNNETADRQYYVSADKDKFKKIVSAFMGDIEIKQTKEEGGVYVKK